MINKHKIGVFSGRFDGPNLGHVLTINHIAQDYEVLIVPILDYKQREACTAKKAKQIFEYYFRSIKCDFDIRFVIGDVHFGSISSIEFFATVSDKFTDLRFSDVTYLSGNLDVLKHISSLGIKTKYVPRVTIPGIDQYLFESTKIRKTMKKEHKSLCQIYNIKIK